VLVHNQMSRETCAHINNVSVLNDCSHIENVSHGHGHGHGCTESLTHLLPSLRDVSDSM